MWQFQMLPNAHKFHEWIIAEQRQIHVFTTHIGITKDFSNRRKHKFNLTYFNYYLWALTSDNFVAILNFITCWSINIKKPSTVKDTRDEHTAKEERRKNNFTKCSKKNVLFAKINGYKIFMMQYFFIHCNFVNAQSIVEL